MVPETHRLSHGQPHSCQRVMEETAFNSTSNESLENPDYFSEEASFYQKVLCPVPEKDFKHRLQQNDIQQLQISLSGQVNFVYDNDKNSVLVIGNDLEKVKAAHKILANLLGINENPRMSALMGSKDHLHDVPKHPWDVPAVHHSEFHDVLAAQTSLPPELGNMPQQSEGIWNGQPKANPYQLQHNVLGTHLPISRTVSDSYSQQKQQMNQTRRSTNKNSFASPRNKRESEDSSYDSDHDGHEYALGSLKLPSVQVSRSHDDVSRTPSETLGAEFLEYVTIRPSIPQPTLPRSRESSPNALLSFKEDNAIIEVLELEGLMRDPSYNGKVEFALKLGYSEALLQKALMKLGMEARENQILEELIRLQRSKPGLKETLINSEQQQKVSPQISFGLETPSATEISKETVNRDEANLLPIVIDGSNVAMSHGNKNVFSCKGIRICVNWFQNRGHKEIVVFVPMWRKESSKPDSPITDQGILLELEKEQLLTFTPSRQFLGKRVVCHDDRFILNFAAESGAIVVTNDNYRDLINDKPEYKKVIEEKILMYSFVQDKFMPPDDPLGRNGPTLDQFLRKKPTINDQIPCPYGKKCTYGNKCKFYHAERGNQPQKSITDKLKENSQQKISEVRAREHSRDSSPGDPLIRTKSMQPLQRTSDGNMIGQEDKKSLYRTKSTFPRVNTEMNNNQSTTATTTALQNPIHSTLSHLSQPQTQFWQRSPAQQTLSLSQTPLIQPPRMDSGLNFDDMQRKASTTTMPWQPRPPMSTLPDTSQPPPPPRGPWSTPISNQSVPDQDGGNSNFGHQKLRRQLTLNPNFDPRIHRNSFPFPPPTDIPPPNFGTNPVTSKTNNLLDSGNELLHSTVTRNLSAPEQISTTSFSLAANPAASLPLTAPEMKLRHSHLHRMSSTSDTQLHKALSEGLNVTETNTSTEPTTVSSLFGSSNGVWKTSKVHTESAGGAGALSSTSGAPKDRSKLYYHLAQLFPEDQVIHAMGALPDETDVQKICAYMICLNNQKQSK